MFSLSSLKNFVALYSLSLYILCIVISSQCFLDFCSGSRCHWVHLLRQISVSALMTYISFSLLCFDRTFWQVYWESASRSQNKNKFISLADKKYLIYLCHTSNKPGRLPEKPIKRDKRQAAGIVQIVKVFQCTHSLRALQPDSAVETRDFAEDKYSTRKSPV